MRWEMLDEVKVSIGCQDVIGGATRIGKTLPSNLLTAIADRIGIIDRAAASIASATLQDLGVITEEDKTYVIGRMKIRRTRSTNRRVLIKDNRYPQITENRGLFFDGRKDITIVKEKRSSKLYKKVISEVHVSLIREPNSRFLGHVTPKSGTGKDMADSIMEILKDRKQNKKTFELYCCWVLWNRCKHWV
ncbi:hypothetical protein HNY73_010759 [Argiope bruennichi]|uniref:Uncharacterized protein n=1 Tax=Argiope bruennichi TaxID=94029 RepID=A0A8T0F4H8_ARGBR|nr:hypothetical protein HNY73_010759 [Argiope bruennichi]